ncbi:MAG: hypothetical protein KKE73_10920 [Proteobacteria bacterium]|nr:hypothetical protein [Pseudomonadota bacterium]
MSNVKIKYIGKKKDLVLDRPDLTKKYEFLPQRGMVCDVSYTDAKKLLARSPGSFRLHEGEIITDESSQFSGAIAENAVALKQTKEGTDTPQGGETLAGTEGNDTLPADSDAISPEEAMAEMEAGGYKLPANVKKAETIMAHYEKFKAEQAEG